MNETQSRAMALGALVALATVAGSATVAAVVPPTAVDVDATPSDPNDSRSTHSIVFTVGENAESAGTVFEDVVVDYSVGEPAADVSNVGADSMGRIGVDRGGDDPGTRIDDAANVSSVSGKKDGNALRVATEGSLTLREGDEVVLVIRPVQNPQNAGDPQVEVTVNSQAAADAATDHVTYEYNDATVTFENQTTAGESVTVRSVDLSEGGFVVVQNRSGATPGEVRGASRYLPAGNHSNVTVALDPAVDEDTELTAQVYLDTDGDERYRYDDSGGDVDGPYRDRDGNVMASASARLTYDSDAGTATPTPTPTATTGGDGGGDDGTATPTATASGDDGDSDGTATQTPSMSPTGATGTAGTTDTADERAGRGPTETTSPGQAGFGLLAALGAFAAAALLGRR